MSKSLAPLKMLPRNAYIAIDELDPLRFYFWPILGKMYRRRVELCLNECKEGQRVLDIGYGSGINFLNLNDKYEEIHGLDLDSPPEKTTAIFESYDIEIQLKQGDVLDMPYPDEHFDTVLLISILEHIKPEEQDIAFREIKRVLKPGGQVVYGAPVERPLMNLAFWLLGANIRDHHFSTQEDIADAAHEVFEEKKIIKMYGAVGLLGQVYEVGHFIKSV